jgi:aryl-alcohol dehydrogenase-like predicted oxidoreductase
MLKRRPGRTDLDVSVLCFGGNIFGWTTDDAQSAAVLDTFMEAGGNLYLYQAHSEDPETPLEETMAAFDDLVKQGKVRWVGASNYTAPRLAEANAVAAKGGWARYESIQPVYNLVQRSEYEADLEPLCQKDELGVITYSSLAAGFLTGKYQPGAALPSTGRASGVQQRYINEKNWGVLAAVESVAKRLGATPAQVALAWIASRPGMTGPIASATTPAQLEEIIGGIGLTLDDEAIATLDKASA